MRAVFVRDFRKILLFFPFLPFFFPNFDTFSSLFLENRSKFVDRFTFEFYFVPALSRNCA